MPFSLRIADTDEPVRLAMADRESPCFTTYRVAFGLVLALTTTVFGLGFDFDLATSGSDFPAEDFVRTTSADFPAAGFGLITWVWEMS